MRPDEWAERELLDAFWFRTGRGGIETRLDELVAYAAVVVARPEGWDAAAVRLDGAVDREAQIECFACFSRARRTYWHHIIQIQNGGSNDGRNIVGICHACHRRIHPWLPEPEPTEVRGYPYLLCELMKDQPPIVVHGDAKRRS